MYDRIQEILKYKNLNAAQFADAIGVQRSSISHVLSGRNKPSLEFIQKILKTYPEISSDWLITGKGSIIRGNFLHSNEAISNEDDTLGLSKMRPKTFPQVMDELKEHKKPPSKDIKSIERVIIFYKNGEFQEYTPEN